jgi:muramoyltetrapeptide carboxypeptidase LdcA involved in peptidoglycan recycling
MEAFADPEIRGIVSTIGGDDSLRILRHLDLGVLRAHPKVFVGYSDTTVTHFACLAAGLVSFYGPAFMAGFAENGGVDPYLAASVRRTLFTAEPAGEVVPNADGWTVEWLDWADRRRRSGAARAGRAPDGAGSRARGRSAAG